MFVFLDSIIHFKNTLYRHSFPSPTKNNNNLLIMSLIDTLMND